MTATLVLKLLRDLRLPLAVVAALLAGFQCLWAKVTQRIIGQLAPFFNTLAGFAGLSQRDIQDVLFEGPGRIARTLIGGDYLALDNAMDLLSIGYVHPLMQTIFCIWAVGRAAGAVAGELDRGTMELLMAQPLPRWRLLFAHFCVDLLTIPVLCLSLWGGTWLGTWLTGPFQIEEVKLPQLQAKPNVIVEVGPFKVRLEDPTSRPKATQGTSRWAERQRLRVEPAQFGRALPLVGGLIFAVSGYTMWMSSAGRFRWRVLGLAVLITLLQFLVNLIGQLWDVVAPLRPLTIFYYYQPQQAVLGGEWSVPITFWNGAAPLCRVPMLAVLYGVGLVGYALALRTFTRRDLPAPL
jgi:ABC-2 type transport system permease protein